MIFLALLTLALVAMAGIADGIAEIRDELEQIGYYEDEE
jgi:hypothetical protein